MKKALEIWIDDDAELKNLCGAFICWKGTNNSLTMLSEKIPDDAEGLYLPFDKQEEPTRTQWLTKEGIKGNQFISLTFQNWEAEEAGEIGIGDRIASILAKKGMSQKDLARAIKSTETSISRYVSNQRVPGANVIIKIANALGVSADMLLGMKEGTE